MQTEKLKLLILCTGNSCRSQMAEGFVRYFHADSIEVWSAGIEAHGLNQNAVMVMAESGVDISDHTSTSIYEILDIDFDYIITVCGHARENCPLFPRPVKQIHIGFDDPPKLAENDESEEEALNHYRRVRDEIALKMKDIPQILEPLK